MLLDAIVPIKPVYIIPSLLNPAAPIDCRIHIKLPEAIFPPYNDINHDPKEPDIIPAALNPKLCIIPVIVKGNIKNPIIVLEIKILFLYITFINLFILNFVRLLIFAILYIMNSNFNIFHVK